MSAAILKTAMTFGQRGVVVALAGGTFYGLYSTCSIVYGIRQKRIAWEAENPDFKESAEYKAVLDKEAAEKAKKKASK
jgi:hypothetical protein